MNGADYVAVVNLYGPPPEHEVRARPGETCERVDPLSLGWLLEGGYIRPGEAPSFHDGYFAPELAKDTVVKVHKGERVEITPRAEKKGKG